MKYCQGQGRMRLVIRFSTKPMRVQTPPGHLHTDAVNHQGASSSPVRLPGKDESGHWEEAVPLTRR
jgi:hypothetical protein